jgi:hypothetical protein
MAAKGVNKERPMTAVTAEAAPDAALEEVAELLSEQIQECHRVIKGLFKQVSDPTLDYAMQLVTLRHAGSLMQASASAASALKRLKGQESRHLITVSRGAATDVPPDGPRLAEAGGDTPPPES